MTIGDAAFDFQGDAALLDQPHIQQALASWLSAAQPVNPTQLDRIEGLVQKLMSEMDDLTVIVGKLVTDIDTVIGEGQAASDDLHRQLDAAIASGKANADELAAMKASAVSLTSALSAADAKVTAAGANLTPPVTLPPAVPDPAAQ